MPRSSPQERTRADLLAARGAPPLRDIFEPIDEGELPPAPPFLTYTDGVTL
ncbi:hypothetical protein [Actinophytocola sp.]|uniref:hypothetical protein n=1 Tax=Actinophytocola sp. TaxID=1872138 RepID=UPI0038999B5B